MKIEIPYMPEWMQISGDMNPGTYGGLIARSDGNYIELREIQPVVEYVGEREAADVGFPVWSREAEFSLEDLDPANNRGPLEYIGMTEDMLEEQLSRKSGSCHC